MKLFNYFIIIFSAVLLMTCAKKGRPTGGPKDETAPLLVSAKPPYGSTNFKQKSIKIYFDEYIVLKNLQKQLIISPPFKNQPLITPQGMPSKYINIKFTEDLQPNTTYTFNFGNAVQDNNENNKLESFKYVFSTGNKIDSLELSGKIIDAFDGKLKKNASALLYRLDSTYNDSILFKEKPNYVASTLDSLNFKFSNVKEGKYIIIALQEDANDYIFNPKNDKIGFLVDTISLPKDSVLAKPIAVFKEIQPFKFKRGREVQKGKIQFAFTGQQKDFGVELLSETPSDFRSKTQFEKDKDTLNYWFTPIEKRDSLNFIVKNDTFLDTIKVNLRKKKIDSLIISFNKSATLKPDDTLFVNANIPIAEIDDTKFSLNDKDSIKVPYKIQQKNATKLAVLFEKSPEKRYKLSLFPNAITDIYRQTNDTIKRNFRTKNLEEYGTISLNIDNKTRKNLIIELIRKKEVIKKEFLTADVKSMKFDYLTAKKYKIRAIIDENDNKKWDTGNFLKKIQPEQVIYFNKEIELRANWVIDETFVIE